MRSRVQGMHDPIRLISADESVSSDCPTLRLRASFLSGSSGTLPTTMRKLVVAIALAIGSAAVLPDVTAAPDASTTAVGSKPATDVTSAVGSTPADEVNTTTDASTSAVGSTPPADSSRPVTSAAESGSADTVVEETYDAVTRGDWWAAAGGVAVLVTLFTWWLLRKKWPETFGSAWWGVAICALVTGLGSLGHAWLANVSPDSRTLFGAVSVFLAATAEYVLAKRALATTKKPT